MGSIGDIQDTTNIMASVFNIDSSIETYETTNEVIIIDSSNIRLGIGVANPSYPLHVQGDINFTGNLFKDGDIFNNSSITDLSSYVYGTIDSSISTIFTKISDIESFSNIDASISIINTSISNIDASISNIDASISIINTNISNIDQSFTNVDASISIINTNIGNIDASISIINTNIGNIDASISIIDQKFTSIDQSFTSIDLSLTSIDLSLSSLYDNHTNKTNTHSTILTTISQEVFDISKALYPFIHHVELSFQVIDEKFITISYDIISTIANDISASIQILDLSVDKLQTEILGLDASFERYDASFEAIIEKFSGVSMEAIGQMIDICNDFIPLQDKVFDLSQQFHPLKLEVFDLSLQFNSLSGDVSDLSLHFYPLKLEVTDLSLQFNSLSGDVSDLSLHFYPLKLEVTDLSLRLQNISGTVIVSHPKPSDSLATTHHTRLKQTLNSDISFSPVNGYYALSQNKMPMYDKHIITNLIEKNNSIFSTSPVPYTINNMVQDISNERIYLLGNNSYISSFNEFVNNSSLSIVTPISTNFSINIPLSYSIFNDIKIIKYSSHFETLFIVDHSNNVDKIYYSNIIGNFIPINVIETTAELGSSANSIITDFSVNSIIISDNNVYFLIYAHNNYGVYDLKQVFSLLYIDYNDNTHIPHPGHSMLSINHISISSNLNIPFIFYSYSEGVSFGFTELLFSEDNTSVEFQQNAISITTDISNFKVENIGNGRINNYILIYNDSSHCFYNLSGDLNSFTLNITAIQKNLIINPPIDTIKKSYVKNNNLHIIYNSSQAYYSLNISINDLSNSKDLSGNPLSIGDVSLIGFIDDALLYKQNSNSNTYIIEENIFPHEIVEKKTLIFQHPTNLNFFISYGSNTYLTQGQDTTNEVNDFVIIDLSLSSSINVNNVNGIYINDKIIINNTIGMDIEDNYKLQLIQEQSGNTTTVYNPKNYLNAFNNLQITISSEYLDMSNIIILAFNNYSSIFKNSVNNDTFNNIKPKIIQNENLSNPDSSLNFIYFNSDISNIITYYQYLNFNESSNNFVNININSNSEINLVNLSIYNQQNPQNSFILQFSDISAQYLETIINNTLNTKIIYPNYITGSYWNNYLIGGNPLQINSISGDIEDIYITFKNIKNVNISSSNKFDITFNTKALSFSNLKVIKDNNLQQQIYIGQPIDFNSIQFTDFASYNTNNNTIYKDYLIGVGKYLTTDFIFEGIITVYEFTSDFSATIIDYCIISDLLTINSVSWSPEQEMLLVGGDASSNSNTPLYIFSKYKGKSNSLNDISKNIEIDLSSIKQTVWSSELGIFVVFGNKEPDQQIYYSWSFTPSAEQHWSPPKTFTDFSLTTINYAKWESELGAFLIGGTNLTNEAVLAYSLNSPDNWVKYSLDENENIPYSLLYSKLKGNILISSIKDSTSQLYETNKKYMLPKPQNIFEVFNSNTINFGAQIPFNRYKKPYSNDLLITLWSDKINYPKLHFGFSMMSGYLVYFAPPTNGNNGGHSFYVSDFDNTSSEPIVKIIQNGLTVTGAVSASSISATTIKQNGFVVATKNDLTAYATTNDLTAYATTNDLTAYATTNDLTAYATTNDLNIYAKKTDTKLLNSLTIYDTNAKGIYMSTDADGTDTTYSKNSATWNIYPIMYGTLAKYPNGLLSSLNFVIYSNSSTHFNNNSPGAIVAKISGSTIPGITMNSFTGQHRCIMNNKINANDYGLIVVSTSKYIDLDNNLNPTINNSLPVCKIVDTDYSKSIFGVISNQEDEERNYSAGNFITPIIKTNKNEKRIFINSVGEGGIWVCNKNGGLENGDYIVSSTVTGYGMRQLLNEEFLCRYTVAKITCDCNFSLTKTIKQKVKVYLDQNGEQNLYYNIDGDVEYEDDLDANGNQQLVYKFETRFLHANGTKLADEQEYQRRKANGEDVYIACFVGCSYHCG